MGLVAELKAREAAEARRTATRQAGEALRESIADLGRRSDEYGGRTATALEALLTLTERQSQETEEREQAMLALARRSMWISVAATAGTFISTVAALIAVLG